jgi:hypothetical protein
MIDRVFLDRVTAGLTLLYHQDSTGPVKYADDTDYSVALGGYLSVRIATFLAWDAELSERVAGYGATYPAWSTAVKFISWRHTFSIVVSNTEYISSDGIVANSPRGFGDLIMGFTITREVDFGE